MRKTSYRLLDLGDEVSVQFKLTSTEERGWQDRIVEQALGAIENSLTHERWRRNEANRSWEVPYTSWVDLRPLLEASGYQVEHDLTRLCSGKAEELAQLPFALSPFVFAPMLIYNMVAHIVGLREIPPRPFFSLMLLLILGLSVRFGRFEVAAIASLLAMLYNPFWPIRLGNWWLWQPINWSVILFFMVGGTLISIRAEKERQAQNWWLYLR